MMATNIDSNSFRPYQGGNSTDLSKINLINLNTNKIEEKKIVYFEYI